MTQFRINLTDGRVAEVACTEITTRQDGSLWALRADAPKPAALTPVAVFAARTWTTCFADGAQILWHDAPTQPATPKKDERTPRFA